MKVLITGTASGIGKGCAEFFLKENHEVYGFDKNISSIQHPKYTHFCLDIRDKSSYPEIGQVDILINNAGVQNGDDIDVNRTLRRSSQYLFCYYDRISKRAYRF